MMSLSSAGHMAALCIALVLAVLGHAQQYVLESAFSGPTFFDNFNFYTGYDPSQGYVHYVDQPTAEAYGMITLGNTSSWGVETTQLLDPTTNLGRLSVRLVSKGTYNHGLFVLDLIHMPVNHCGTWPAFWTLGGGQWPQGGEIDIIEFSNTLHNNIMAMHTSPGCSVAGADQSGTLITNDCGADSGFTGCGVTLNNPNNIGNGFNANGGGVYAMEWTSDAVRIWFFPRNAIPSSLINVDPSVRPDTSTFGLPVANFAGSCNVDAFLRDHALVFDIDFCGQWAGNTWSDEGCPMLDPTNGWKSCNEFVAANPKAFTDAYWEVNSLNIYQAALTNDVASSSSLSSVTPVISVSSVSEAISDAHGQSTTPFGTPNTPMPPKTFGPGSMSSVQYTPTAYTVSLPTTNPNHIVELCPPKGGGDWKPCLPLPEDPRSKRDASSQSGGHIGWCGVPGGSCPEPPSQLDSMPIGFNEETSQPRDAEPQIGGGTIDWCGVPGAGCPGPVRIVDEPIPITVEPRDPQKIEGGTIDWCGVPGAGCPDPVRIVDEPVSISIEPREAQTIGGGTIDWCGVPGSSCNSRNKPESQNLSSMKDKIEDKRDAEPQVTGGHIGFCGVPGASCVEHYEDEVTMADSISTPTTNIVVPSNEVAEPHLVEVTSIVDFYKRSIGNQATVTCTPVQVIASDDSMSRGGCKADEDAKKANEDFAAHTTMTIS
ncbi:Hypothetical protein R9X50_00551100 [Acrodontium crateriforme]|uniref:GH16 domain-containing protein n=1 Tax=Acrodontium crateriforme TaxID=150365 RepID=A0AAQ3R605_9PEZI|nr:Hypothetical protein R9X50_00551100 [Acrodontium crateriforme]